MASSDEFAVHRRLRDGFAIFQPLDVDRESSPWACYYGRSFLAKVRFEKIYIGGRGHQSEKIEETKEEGAGE